MNIDELMARLKEYDTDPIYKVGDKFKEWQIKDNKRRLEIYEKYPDYMDEVPVSMAMALFNEEYPTGNPETDNHWKMVRDIIEQIDPLERLYNRWGVCEECGYEGPIQETYLTWVCHNPECVNAVNEWYEAYHTFHRKLIDSSADDFASMPISIRKKVIENAKYKGIEVLQEWVSTIERFVEIVMDKKGISIEEARESVPELIKLLREGKLEF